MQPGTKEFKQAERQAQERNNIPIDKAGLDYISRTTDWEKYRDCPLWDNLKKKQGEKKNG